MSWSLTWSLGGLSGTVDDVDVQWSESISLTRSSGNWRRASFDVVLPVDMRTQRAHPRTGAAALYWNGVQVIDGPWRSPEYQQTSDGRARFAFELSDDDQDDRGTWPPVSMQYPRRGPREISNSQIVIEPGPRTWGGQLPGRWLDVPILSSVEFPNIAEPADGATWPYPIGMPGRGASLPAVPAYVYDTRITGGNTRKAGLAGVPIDCATVTVYGPVKDTWTIEVVGVLNSHAYTLNLVSGGIAAQAVTYTSDGSATDLEIATGLVNAWNDEAAVSGTAFAARTGTSTLMIIGSVPGVGFFVTSSDANLTLAHTSIAKNTAPQTGVTVHPGARDNGTAYAYFEMGDLTDIDSSPANTFYWSAESDATPSGAGDVLVSILAASSLAVDWLEWSRVADRLNRYKIDGYCDAPTTPMAFARGAVLPLLPVSVVPGPLGMRPVLWPFLDDGQARGLELVDGIGIAVSDRVTYLEAPQLQSMTVNYRYNPATGRTVAVTTASAENNVYATLTAQSSDTDEYEARYLSDAATAQQVAADALRWLSWSPRVLEVQVTDLARYGPQGTDDLYVGRRVVLTSEQHSITGQAAVIADREWDAQIALVRVYLLDDPLTAV